MNVGVVASRLEFPRQENPESGARQQSANDDSAKAPPQRTSMRLASAWQPRSACAEQFETSTSACSLHTLGSSCSASLRRSSPAGNVADPRARPYGDNRCPYTLRRATRPGAVAADGSE